MSSLLPHDEAGSGPPVVLLHAGVADRTMWTEHIEVLARSGRRVIAPDLPGFGDAPATGSQAPWDVLADTLRALDATASAIVACSFGAAVALRLALLHPALVSGMCLASTPVPGIEPSAETREAWAAENAALDDGDLDGAVRAVVDAWVMPTASTAVRERVAAMQRRAFELGPLDDGPEPPDPLDDDPRRLAELTQPVLALAGEHDKPEFRLGAEHLAGTVRDGRSTVLAGAGHLAPLETPRAFQRIVLEVLGAHRRTS